MSRVRHGLTVASFMAPAGIGIVVFFVYPLISAVYFSFTKFDLLTPPEWVGLRNYRHMFDDPYLHQAAWNTLWLVLVLVPARMLGGLGSALLLNSLRRARGRLPHDLLPARAGPAGRRHARVRLPAQARHRAGQPVPRASGHQGPLWFNSAAWAKPSLVLLGLWGVGDVMVHVLGGAARRADRTPRGRRPGRGQRVATVPARHPAGDPAGGAVRRGHRGHHHPAVLHPGGRRGVRGQQPGHGRRGRRRSTSATPRARCSPTRSGSTGGFRYNLSATPTCWRSLLFVVAFAVTLVLIRRSRTLEAAA